MTAASGGPGETPDYQGHQQSGSEIPPVDPAYGDWQSPPVYPPPVYPPPVYPPAPPVYPPAPGYPAAPGYPPPQFGPPHPGYGYQGYPAAQSSFNVLAIISLVASIAGVFCFIGSLLAIVAGVLAIAQIKRTGARGFGMAVAGTAAGVAGLLLYIVMVVSALR